MNRRDFLKSMLGAATLAAIPVPLVEAFVNEETDTLTFGDIVVEYPGDGEWGMIIHANGHSLADVYEVTRKLVIG